MSKQYEQIIKLLDDAGADYEVIEHEPVVTSEEADNAIGNSAPEQGIKALVLKSGDRFILCAVRGTNKLDYKKVRKITRDRKLRFATPKEVRQVTGVDIGACYPLGSVAGIEMLVDETIAENRTILFSPGVHNKHIRMKWSDYSMIVAAKLVDLQVASVK